MGVQVALLMLLSAWAAGCAGAVRGVLRAPGAAGWLVAQVCAGDHDDNEALLQGLAAFLLAICMHFNDDSVENYSKVKLSRFQWLRVMGSLFKVNKIIGYSTYVYLRLITKDE